MILICECFNMLYLTPIFAILYLTPTLVMLYLTPIIVMLYLTPIIVMLYLTLIFVMLYLTRDIWHRHSVFTPVLSIYTDTWHVTLDMLFMTPALGIYTGTRYVDPVLDICHTWHLHLTHGIWYAFMWYKYLDLTSWPLTGHYYPWYLCYMTYSWLSLLQGLGMIIISLPDILYSCTPEFLYTWTPEIGRLLILLRILYSCWSP